MYAIQLKLVYHLESNLGWIPHVTNRIHIILQFLYEKEKLALSSATTHID